MMDWPSLSCRDAIELIEKSGRSYAKFSLACSLKGIKTPDESYFADAISSLDGWRLFRPVAAEDVKDLLDRLPSTPYMRDENEKGI